MNLTQFLADDRIRNVWLKESHMKVYVRRSHRMIDATTTVPCLDLGNVEVSEKYRGKGIFTKFLKRFEFEAKKLNRGVYVESILEPRLAKFLLRNGYSLVHGTCEDSPSVIKTVDFL